jgi:hypothetical protein
MKNSTYSCCSQTVSTVKKSAAIMLRVRSQELAPCRTTAFAGRTELRVPKPHAHRGGRHRLAKALQFADDALIAPLRVLSRHPQDQLSDFAFEWAGDPLAARTSNAWPPSADASAAASLA